MSRRSHWPATLLTALSLALLATAWLALGPVQLGGQAAYVIVDGNSMEPLYHRGDLVLLREQPSYEVGDVVTYRHPRIGPVIHRIIGRDGPRYVFKGDHNGFVDPYEPARGELIGKAWFKLPSAGKTLTQLREPRNMALLGGAGGLLMFAPLLKSAERPGKRKRAARQSAPAARATPLAAGPLEAWLAALAFLAVASLALAALAFTRPATRATPDEIVYHHVGAFGYTAAAPAGVYDSSTVQTGQPLFPRLTNSATFTFDYRLEAERPAHARGSYRLAAEVLAPNGWKRTVELRPPTPFDGGAFSASGRLDFAKVRALTDYFEQQTGLRRQSYTLAIVPEVSIEGQLNGADFADTFAPRLEFRLDETQAQLLRESGASDPLRPTREGTIKATRVEANTIGFFNLDVTLARWMALAGLGLGLAGALALGLPALRQPRPDQAARVAARYGALLVDVEAISIPPDARVVALTNMRDLAKLAERGGQLIAHESLGARHRYYVHDGAVIYQYQIDLSLAEAPRLRPPAAPEQPPEDDRRAIFLRELREHGMVAGASRAAGMSLREAYAERSRLPAFASAWDEARDARHRSNDQEAHR